MLYSSRNGSLFYYDRVLYSWRIADPAMLFILGFEAVTTFDDSLSDSITISKNIYSENAKDVIEFSHYYAFEKIYSYLSQLNSINDLDTYIKSECYGLKLLLNDSTGTGKDRTIPIIFKNDVNKFTIDINLMNRLSTSQKLNMSYYDLQAQKILDIYADAGYSVNSYNKIKNSAYTNLSTSTLSELTSKEKAIHEERKDNSIIYKLYDFKSMYSYSLGVLYGCRCLGYNPYNIWRLNPVKEYCGRKPWYDGPYTNLVNTAWHTFRFHHTTFIDGIDNSDDTSDKYKGIQPNRIWNFGSESDIDNTINGIPGYPLFIDEIECRSMAVSSKELSNGLLEESCEENQTMYSMKLNGDAEIYRLICFREIVTINGTQCDSISFNAIGYVPNNKNLTWKFNVNETEEPEYEYSLLKIKNTSGCNCKMYGSLLYIPPINNIAEDLDFKANIISCITNDIPIIVTLEYSDETNSISKEWHFRVTEFGLYYNAVAYDGIDTDGQSSTYYCPGKYLDCSSMQWLDVDNFISNNNAGLVLDSDKAIIRYIGEEKVEIYKAYSWQSKITDSVFSNTLVNVQSPMYLSPSENEIYYISTGCLGWVNFNENSWKNEFINHLTIAPVKYKDLPGTVIKNRSNRDQESSIDYIIADAIDRRSNSVVSYYKCKVTDSDDGYDNSRFLYGIFNELVTNYSTDGAYFKEIVSDNLFNTDFIKLNSAAINNTDLYTLETLFDIDKPVKAYLQNSDKSLMYYGDDDNDQPILKQVSTLGLTPKQSIALDAYTVIYYNRSRDEYSLSKSETIDGAEKKSVDLRYCDCYIDGITNTKLYYWSTLFENGEWQYSHDFYIKHGTVNLYRGSSRISKKGSLGLEPVDAYYDSSNNPPSWLIEDSKNTTSTPTHVYAQDIDNFSYIDSNAVFISIDNLYSSYGVTQYLCPNITVDDHGDSLLSKNGKSLVWVDRKNNKYWNGLYNFNRWQPDKPLRYNFKMCTIRRDKTGKYTHLPFNGVYDDDDKIYLNESDPAISYNEFYADNARALVRAIVKVRHEDKPDVLLDCYKDDKAIVNNETISIYYIPNIGLDSWKTEDELYNLGYTLVI